MKVLAIVHAFPPSHGSGAEWMLHDMFQYLMKQGHECKVWITKYAQEDFNGIEAVQESYVQEADLLISHLGQFSRAVNIARENKKPLINIVHNTQAYAPIKAKRHGIYNVFNSYYTFDFLRKDYRRHPYMICHPPIDKEHYGVESSRDHVTLININENKGGRILREIAEKMPDQKFIAVKGAYGHQFTDQPENVTVYENMTDIREVYRQTGILIMPSDYESFGRTAMEAMCSGIPVIAHPTAGLIECIKHGGRFVDRNDTDAWVAEIRDVFDNYEEAKKRAIFEGQEYQYLIEKELKQFEQFCKDAVDNKFNHNY